MPQPYALYFLPMFAILLCLNAFTSKRIKDILLQYILLQYILSNTTKHSRNIEAMLSYKLLTHYKKHISTPVLLAIVEALAFCKSLIVRDVPSSSKTSTFTVLFFKSLSSFTCSWFKRVMHAMVEAGSIFKSLVIIYVTSSFTNPAALTELGDAAQKFRARINCKNSPQVVWS